jgi:hypothetical protein
MLSDYVIYFLSLVAFLARRQNQIVWVPKKYA